jgi:UDP-N-acetylmuramoyl-L-alanyl-D-glutamate--2,6-diaminopimelate ligase
MGQQTVRLCDLLPGATQDPRTITGVALDSRAVAPGFAFFAVSGAKADGNAYIDAAIAKGATAIITERAPNPFSHADVALVLVDHVRQAVSRAAALFYPQQPATIVAVTGTSGKSSVVDFTRQIFDHCGYDAASLGTIGVIAKGHADYGALTTPDPVNLHRTLSHLADAGITHLAMEASSHGLDQHRLDGVRLKAAAFTNLGRDHLDYHPSMDDYFDAKMRLFRTLLPKGAPAIVDTDNEWSSRAHDVARESHPVLSVGRAGTFICLRNIEREGFSQILSVQTAKAAHTLRLNLAGDFQASNALVAAGLALAVGADEDAVFAGLEKLRGVPGRLEPIGTAKGALGIVDYAHKPEALAHALDALRPYARGRLICVFGCGGDRDAGKRPIMGEIAMRKADLVIVTDDNPRSENPASIRQAILAAAPGARDIGDRAEAIRTAVSMLRDGDVLLVAGKGHETGQIIGEKTLPFSDSAVLSAALAEKESAA